METNHNPTASQRARVMAFPPALSDGERCQTLSRCLSLDLEIRRRDQSIRAFAGVWGNTGRTLIFPSGKRRLKSALAELDRLAAEVDFLLGHNLIQWDLPHLHAASPNLQLLNLPAVDTLRLSPLAFPSNPYHHLIKHYQNGQLRRGRISDPELDAKLVLGLFADELNALRRAAPNLLTAWHWLTTAENEEGFDMVFRELRRSPRPPDEEAKWAIRKRLAGDACLTHAGEILKNPGRHGWALAFALAWMSVAGGNSVMPPWVRHQFPEAGRMVRRLRDLACEDSECDWCGERHNAAKELQRWFGFTEFRAEPRDESTGDSMQKRVVETGMRGQHVLALMPTGSGKSLCYQIPALSRYYKTGALTVAISPLVALMADQIRSLERKGIDSCVTINGLLSMPERAEALDRVRLGDAAVLLISPEQLRNVSVRSVLQQREIGAWIVDEAHCLSKWGHDFRPDYRYIGRYIRERAGEDPVPPVMCLTATSKPDVTEEIAEYFKKELDVTLRIFDGGAERKNLEFVVVQTNKAEKFDHIHQIITSDLPEGEPGGVIVYCARRRQAEDVADFLQAKGIAADHFHAGLTPETKKVVQESFIDGELRVIVATNAFGMGIDKPDVRLVIHADIPGSLENYMQEAGRAGRDQTAARCVLLYSVDDVELQFSMSARSRLTRREIHGVLRALRNVNRKNRFNGDVVATPGEILGEDEDQAFVRDSATDDTRVRTAVAWLEEAVLLTREENRVQVFPSSLRLNTVDEARARLERSRIREDYRRQLFRICRALFEADPDEGISTDELMMESGFSSEGVRAALYDLERLGIASNDTVLTAFVHTGVRRASRRRFEQASALESDLIDLMQEMHPDMEVGDSSMLHLRNAAQRLRDEGHESALPEFLRRIVRGIALDGRGEDGVGGSLGVRGRDRETMWVTLRRTWRALGETAEIRRKAASRLLDHLLVSLPRGARGTDLLAETTMGKLLAALKSDMVLMSGVRLPEKLLDRALLWMHEQEVIRLNRGLTVLRPAMTIRLKPERRGFARVDFEPLGIHYDEQILQVHVMAEYAQQGLGAMADAIQLAMDYFNLPRADFLARWLPLPQGELLRQTTPESWRNIVESLNDPAQRRIVADTREQTNVLVLAGPGSGKTRVLVHRIAYLIRVRRENPRGILALTYNRHAAVEIRSRLEGLIGEDARGVMVMTCHALAMRLVGASFTGRARSVGDIDFQKILREAVALLQGEGLPPEEADDNRARLLSGFRWILVDEYQDIGRDQYDLISALAGRTLVEEDDRISLFVVGDDDQNIYTFAGASVEYIRRFLADYVARPAYLTDNYRSSGHIIAAANEVIESARDRMKTGNPIQVNRIRRREASGGEWAERDPVARGRVQILPAGDNAISQAQVVIAELKRLAGLDPGWKWSNCAVVARQWIYLDPVRSLCELEGIPVQLANEDATFFWHLRETQGLLDWLRGRDSRLVNGRDLEDWLAQQPNGPWVELLREAASEFELEAGGAETPIGLFVEWLAEWGREFRRRQEGLLLTTAHRAKGLEFDHVVVLDGAWHRVGKSEDRDAPRRLYYVAMTRSRQTLTLMRFPGRDPFQDDLHNSPSVLRRPSPVGLPTPMLELGRLYRRLSLGDVFLSFAGNRSSGHAVHRAIAALSPGDPLKVQMGSKRWELLDRHGVSIGQLAGSFSMPAGASCTSGTVLAVATWDKESSEPPYRERLLCDSWEVVIPELVFERGGNRVEKARP